MAKLGFVCRKCGQAWPGVAITAGRTVRTGSLRVTEEGWRPVGARHGLAPACAAVLLRVLAGVPRWMLSGLLVGLSVLGPAPAWAEPTMETPQPAWIAGPAATPALAPPLAPAPAPAPAVAPALAPASVPTAAPPASAARAVAPPTPVVGQARWLAVPRVAGRLRARDIGLVINTADPYSVAVGAHYIATRGLRPEQVLRLELPLRPDLSSEDFARLQQAIARKFGPRIQALALAWVAPYAVGCNAITGALALGLDLELCRNSCAPSRPSPYFNVASHRPWHDLRLRPAMLLAAPSVEQARALIDRGVAADGSLRLRGRPPVTALMLATTDAPRRVRMALYPSAGLLPLVGVDVRWLPAEELPRTPRVLMALTGSARVQLDPPPDWVPGGLGDHLTSIGGALLGQTSQTTALEWIASGATASHGSVSEPCNHLQKFPHPQALLLHYLQGSTALEAYWKSVAWPQQSLFIGEPLAAPFASPD